MLSVNVSVSNRVLVAFRRSNSSGIYPLRTFLAPVAADSGDEKEEIDSMAFGDMPVQARMAGLRYMPYESEQLC